MRNGYDRFYAGYQAALARTAKEAVPTLDQVEHWNGYITGLYWVIWWSYWKGLLWLIQLYI